MKDTLSSPIAFRFFASTLVLLSLLFSGGCSQSDTAKATDRSSTKTPKFRTDLAKQSARKEMRVPASGKTLDFVHADHFGIVSIDVARVIESETLSDVQWPELEKLLSDFAGTGDLKDIEKVWFVLDRESFSLLPTGDDSENPMIIVIDQAKEFDLAATADQLETSWAENLLGDPLNLKLNELIKVTQFKSVYFATKKRMLIGSHDTLSKLVEKPNPNQLLVDRYYQNDEQYVSGVIDMSAVRPQLQMIFGMVASFGPMQDYAKLPQALEQVSFDLDLDADRLMKLNFTITDKPLAQLIANSIQSSGSSSIPGMGAGSGMGMGGLGGMFGGGMPNLKAPKIMFEPESTEAMQNVGKEISENDLLQVRLKDDQVKIELGRPGSLDQLVGSFLIDQNRASELALRTLQASQIAEALKAFEKEFDRLPAAGWIKPDDAGEKVRAQFNWQTGILPELGYQDLYDQFDFSKPFDEGKNLELSRSMPKEFGTSPINQEQNATSIGRTSFRAIGGSGLWGDGKSGPELNAVKDRKYSTAIVGEIENPMVWTNPEAGLIQIENLNEVNLGQPDELGWLVVTANFKVRAISKESNEALSAIISFNEGDKVPSDQFIQLDLPENSKDPK